MLCVLLLQGSWLMLRWCVYICRISLVKVDLTIKGVWQYWSSVDFAFTGCRWH